MNLISNVFYRYGALALMRKGALLLILALLMAFPADARPLRILAFGDSLTQGYGLLERDGFVPQLQAWVDAQGADVTIVNGGVSGDTTAGGAARIEWSLTPDIRAMILTLGGNDLLRGLPPEAAKANLGTIVKAAVAQDLPVLIVGMQAPGNYGADYKEAFDAMYRQLAESYDLLYHESFLGPLGDTPKEALQFMQPDGVHPNEAGVRKIVEAIGPKVLALAERAGD